MKMNKRIILDYIMLLVLLPLMVKPLTGIYVHEILGMGFAVLTGIHCYNNKGWLGNIRKTFGKKEITWKKIVQLLINCFLLLAFALTLISGIMVSIVLFGFLNIPYHEIFYKIHTSSAKGVLILSIVHLLLHIKMVIKSVINSKGK